MTNINQNNPRGDLEHRYYSYLRNQGYATTDALLGVLRAYLPYFAGKDRVLDIGCGHGEFLQLLVEAGHEAVGVDIDPAMVAACSAQGLTAYEADVLDWLPTQANSFDAIFSSNVVEHLDAKTVQQLIDGAYQALRPGGLLLIGTPNPESLIVQFYEFWRDPTHVRLYSRQLLEFFFADAGFDQIQNGNNAAAAWEGLDAMLAPIPSPVPLDRQNPLPLPPLGELPPLPPPPAAGAPLRQRLTFGVVNFVFKKFMEPYIAPLRDALTAERRYAQGLESALQHLTAQIEQNEAQHQMRFQQLSNGLRFPYQSREHFVLGYKAAPASAAPTDQLPTPDAAPTAAANEE